MDTTHSYVFILYKYIYILYLLYMKDCGTHSYQFPFLVELVVSIYNPQIKGH